MTTNKCATSPLCSHNTNGRDMDKPCSIELGPHTSPVSEVIAQAVKTLDKELDIRFNMALTVILACVRGEVSEAYRDQKLKTLNIDATKDIQATLNRVASVARMEAEINHDLCVGDALQTGLKEGAQAMKEKILAAIAGYDGNLRATIKEIRTLITDL